MPDLLIEQYVVQNVLTKDYEHKRAEGQEILEKVDSFVRQQFPENGEATPRVKVCSIPN